jgi:AbrB family looped-hinge helix DNA binding protein
VKKYPKIVQCDKRGQIVIPKDVRQELGVDEGSAFWMYSITEEGILLKLVKEETLAEHSFIVNKLKQKADKIGIPEDKIDRTVDDYKKKPKGRLEEI